MSKIYVDEIAGIASANTVAIPGHVIQVVQATTTTQVTTTSTSHTSTGFSASITPTSASSKILIVGTSTLRMPTGGNNYQHTFYRDGTTNLAPNQTRGFIQVRDAGGSASDGTFTAMYLDSPNTTSATTYTWYHRSEGGITCWFAIDGSYAQITLMEIAG